MKLTIGKDLAEFKGTAIEIFLQLLELAGRKKKKTPYILNSYADILHRLCYAYDEERYNHIQSVYKYLIRINFELMLDYTPPNLKIMAVYHDIAKGYDKENHANVASDIFNQDIIAKYFLTEKKFNDISDAIRYHSFDCPKNKREDNILAIMLYDADSIRKADDFKNDIIDTNYVNSYIEAMHIKKNKIMMSNVFKTIMDKNKKE